ncbi:SDR family oxidoreductase [Sphingomonas sp. NFR15]|uniref:SDR family oxidoreductase n=1 Tax=Sphingomonas sp. NFR15 TaxID=1566282 RepID=UPI00088ED192|nr:SDR family oxidoreductase [Sphingomonas sp. NFR15]SDA35075.1 NADP-dependent 3-hydroxy acid dehydrogenase YdfG [Sphingomonas sp. NFR15]
MTKSIFITGGASGIGRATAILFARHGWRVGLADIDADGLTATRALLPPGMAETHVMDVCDRAGWVAALDAFTAPAAGRLDVLFNNAGIATGGPLTATGFDAIDRTVAINFVGVLNGAKIGHAYLARTPGACLLNTASASAIYGSAGLATYSATKFAVRGLTEALDGEWARDGIRVRAIVPAFVETPLLDGRVEGGERTIRETVRAAGLERTPADRVARAAWDAVHGARVHTYVGRTAHIMALAARFAPMVLRNRMRRA